MSGVGIGPSIVASSSKAGQGGMEGGERGGGKSSALDIERTLLRQAVS